MVIALSEAGQIRDLMHNLDLTIEKHQKIYDKLLFQFISKNEVDGGKAILEVHPDRRKKNPNSLPTIGHGFNMGKLEAKEEWVKALGGKVSFEQVLTGKKITEEQALKLYTYVIEQNRKCLKTIYRENWQKLKANERAIIEDVYYNCPGLVRSSSVFYKNIIEYINSSEPKDLEKALSDIKERGGKDKEIEEGIKNRRAAQAEMGDSTKCPIYSKPNEDALPQNKKIRAKINSTVIPMKHGNPQENSYKSDRFYIWKTCLDNKVRKEHVVNEGKIFDSKSRPPPPEVITTKDHGCRCTADFYIPNWVEIDAEEKQMIRKYFASPAEFENFVIRDMPFKPYISWTVLDD